MVKVFSSWSLAAIFTTVTRSPLSEFYLRCVESMLCLHALVFEELQWVIDQVWGQDGYRPSSFFASLWTETESRSINSKKRTRPISSHLDRTSLVNKRFIIWLSGKFFLRDTAGSPERARWSYLARQSQRRIWFILPARGASYIIIA